MEESFGHLGVVFSIRNIAEVFNAIVMTNIVDVVNRILWELPVVKMPRESVREYLLTLPVPNINKASMMNDWVR
jgi:hypothetical protein